MKRPTYSDLLAMTEEERAKHVAKLKRQRDRATKTAMTYRSNPNPQTR